MGKKRYKDHITLNTFLPPFPGYSAKVDQTDSVSVSDSQHREDIVLREK